MTYLFRLGVVLCLCVGSGVAVGVGNCDLILRAMENAPQESRFSIRELWRRGRRHHEMERIYFRAKELLEDSIRGASAERNLGNTGAPEPEWLARMLVLREDMVSLRPDRGQWPNGALLMVGEGKSQVQTKLRLLRSLVARQAERTDSRRNFGYRVLGGASAVAFCGIGATVGLCLAKGASTDLLGMGAGMALTTMSIFSAPMVYRRFTAFASRMASRSQRELQRGQAGFLSFIDSAAQALRGTVPGVMRFSVEDERDHRAEAFDIFVSSHADGTPYLVIAYRHRESSEQDQTRSSRSSVDLGGSFSGAQETTH